MSNNRIKDMIERFIGKALLEPPSDMLEDPVVVSPEVQEKLAELHQEVVVRDEYLSYDSKLWDELSKRLKTTKSKIVIVSTPKPSRASKMLFEDVWQPPSIEESSEVSPLFRKLGAEIMTKQSESILELGRSVLKYPSIQ